MVYQNKFVAVVKVNGKILREKEGNDVFLPFGSEYSILLKNLNSLTAKVNVSIDGKDVLDCKSLVIAPNSETELKGEVSGTKAKNKFKFIEKTNEISEYRGDRIDDGIIRIEVFLEKEKTKEIHHNYYYHNYYYNDYKRQWPYWYSDVTDNIQIYCSNTINSDNINNVSTGEFSTTYAETYADIPYTLTNSDGITVKGSEINQGFNYAGYYDWNTVSEVIILRLRGTKQLRNKVEKPLWVKDKLKCKTCGRTGKSSVKFCSNCGTYLE